MDIDTFVATVERSGVVRPGMRVLVAVSGGSDSVALLHLLARGRSALGIALGVAHAHHGLRGAAADGDEQFVTELGEELGLPTWCGRLDLDAVRAEGYDSPAEVARVARYRFLADLAVTGRWDRVALGHQRDDQAETVLLALLRGSGAAGLAGMRPERDALFVRPLLDHSREELRTWLTRHGLRWREDATNRDPRFLRNRIRRELVPVLRAAFGADVDARLAHSAALLTEEDAVVSALADERGAELVEETPTGVRAPVRALADLPAPVRWRVVQRMVVRAGGPVHPLGRRHRRVLERLLASTAGSRRVDLPSGVVAERRYGVLEVGSVRVRVAPFARALPVPGRLVVPEIGQTLVCRVVRRGELGPGDAAATAGAVLAADGPLDAWSVRQRRPGDRMRPTGGAGSRKLSDLLVDARVPAPVRDRLPVVEHAGRIAWVAGLRADEHFRVRPDTRRVLVLRVEPSRG